ncbi:thiamine phosphate synthase [Prevotella dentasini]|uniref:thiamine phosphate synthase n=1 Tax=Prevotella dentasini TaxID=589537 RepID=UPI0004680E10|nr:thiamine phosphate synthase [Prevotella dentasini]
MNNIQYITHSNDRFDHIEGAELALKGGCRWVQLRMKDATDEDFLAAGRRVRELCSAFGATFVLDDRVHLVKELQADGVHLGRLDMPVDEARKYLGDGKIIIGGTANTFDDILKLARQGADYIGCGPFRYTATKKRLAPILGLEGYSRLTGQMKAHGLHVPILAIGGILREDVPAIMATGVSGIAVSGAVLNADDPAREMERFINT